MSSSSQQEKRPWYSLQTIMDFSGPLILGVVCALIWANLDPHGYHAVMHWAPVGHINLHFLVNELFMVLFFGIAAKEITEACLPGGALNPPSRAINPLFATVGGVLGPIGAFFAYLWVSGDSSAANGWGIPTATDIALAWLVARIAFGKSHPAVSFLLLLAVADDGLGLGIIAIFYPDPAHPVEPMFLGLVGAAVLMAYLMRRRGVQGFGYYLMGPGVLSWTGLFMAHLHPALALVVVVPFLPASSSDSGMYAELDEQDLHSDSLNNFEHFFKSPVEVGLFFFGLANAGVGFANMGTATWAVLFALVVGKTAGIFLFGGLAHVLGFKLAEGMSFRSLFVAGMTAGLGLTVALFVAGVAFTEPGLQGAAKMGALFSA
ncbi:MAG: Na+/H+ antiporter NhaA, partial [Deltaproteobacteria bacterium]|nr:Na+/H+ antiporter NhaA [Deltaproteobacteria bacterium]